MADSLTGRGGLWQDDTVSYTYTNRLRSRLSLSQPDADAWTQRYGYDAAKRLKSVTSPAGAFAYSYDPVANLQVNKLTLPNGAYITNAYDSVARLLSTILLSFSLATINSHTYQLNAASQRTQQTFTLGNYISYTYDNIGQLTSALGKEAGGVTNRLQEQLGYAYDAAENLNARTNNGFLQSYYPNSLNELTNVTRATASFTVAGTTTSPATNVTVQGLPAVPYADGTFAATNISLPDGVNIISAAAQDVYGRTASSSIAVTLPASANLTYDLNGNLRTNANPFLTFFIYDYDDENRLIRVTSPSQWKSEFSYDGRMRRRVRKEFTWQSSAWVQTNEVHYIYDGNLVIQERWFNPQVSTTVPQNTITYTRGRDLSGSVESGLPHQAAATAGGIGGLLARTDSGQLVAGLSSAHAFYHCDGSGNITALINTNQALVAKYLYDPFGIITSQSGSLADANLYRFSSKEYHPNSGLICFLYRYYDPSLQRWITRDPLAEVGNVNLFAYVNNSPIGSVDFLGLCDRSLWGLFLDNVYQYWQNGIVNYNNGVVEAVGALISAQLTAVLDPYDFTYNAIAGISAQAGIASTDPFGYAANVWNGFAGAALTSEGIGKITFGAELVLVGGLLAPEAGAAEAEAFSAIGSTGKIGEQYLQTLGGESSVAHAEHSTANLKGRRAAERRRC